MKIVGNSQCVVPKLMRDYPNLYGDLSASGYYALVRDANYAAKFSTEFQDRYMVAKFANS
jgi:hypothetical protein